jgi:PAP2 superfamily
MTVAHEGKSSPTAETLRSVYATIKAHAFPAPWLWQLMLAIGIFDAVFITLSPHLSFNAKLVPVSLGLIAVAALLTWRLSRTRQSENLFYSRFVRCALFLIYFATTSLCLALLNYIVMSSNFPMPDVTLDAWDRSIGFDWKAYANFITTHHLIDSILSIAYKGLMPSLAIVAITDIATGKYRQANEFIGLVIATGVFCILVSGFFPSYGAMKFYHVAMLNKDYLPDVSGQIISQLDLVRGVLPMDLDTSQMTGLSEFPSYHTVIGILVAYGSRSSVYRLVPGLIFSCLLITATPFYGSHYVSDVIAGAVVAVCFIAAGRWLQGKMAIE